MSSLKMLVGTSPLPIMPEAFSPIGLATPCNENPEACPAQVYFLDVSTPGLTLETPGSPTGREVCRHGTNLLARDQRQFQEPTNGMQTANWWVATHPGPDVEPGDTIPKHSVVTAYKLDGEGAETRTIGIDTRTLTPFVQPQVAAAAWAPDTAYDVGDLVTNDSGKVYECVDDGTSASSGGPTGTGSTITDGGATWDYVGSSRVQINVYDQEADFPAVGKRLLCAGTWYRVVSIDSAHLVTVENTGEPGAILTFTA